MSASVRCPVCASACEVPAELLGRTGRCKQCGRRIRLATPTAELLDAPAELAPLDNLGELEPVGDLLPPDAAPPRPPKPRPKRVAAPPRGPSRAAFAAVALVGLLGGGVGGAMLAKDLLPVEQPQPVESAKADPPAPRPPEPKPPEPEPKPQPPEPQPPQPQPPEPQPPEPKPPEPKPKPPEPPVGQKLAVKLPGAANAVFAGGGGRFVVFQTAAGDVAVFDAELGRPFWTLNGGKPDDLIAVGRSKLFLGRSKDAAIVMIDLATGNKDGQATLEGEAAALRHLAIGSATDGPLLVTSRTDQNSYRVRLLDTATFGQLKYPIEDPTAPQLRAFPFTEATVPRWAAMSADGRGLTLGNRFYTRASDQYKGGLLPNAGSAQHLPTTDAAAYVGTRLYAADGTPLAAAALPPGTSRRYIPAAAGPFVVSAEYRAAARGAVALSLHLGADPNPLGPLPGGDDVGAWAKTDAGWVSKLHHHVVFVPNPPRLVVCPPGADTAQVHPVDLTAMLAKAGRAVTFTSTPSADVPTDRAYVYRATAVSARGPVTFRLESGPPGMTVAADGVLNWPKPSALRHFYEVSLTATDAAGAKAAQTFRLLVPRKAEAK